LNDLSYTDMEIETSWLDLVRWLWHLYVRCSSSGSRRWEWHR